MKRLLLPVFMLLPSLAFAGLTGGVSLSSDYESNLFRSSVEESGMVSQALARLGYLLEQEEHEELSQSISFERNEFRFSTDSDLNYSLTSAQLMFGWNSGEQQRFRALLGYESREDREAYAIYDYGAFSLSVDGTFRVGDGGGSVVAGYAHESREYDAQEMYDYNENRLFTQVGIPAGNALNIAVANELGFKSYQDRVSGGGHGMGAHRDGPLAGQWRGTLRISLPLADKTGLRLQLFRSIDIGDTVDYGTLTTGSYLAGEAIYDDRYSYESLEYGMQLSQRLRPDMILRVSGDLACKDYHQDALGLDGAAIAGAGTRNDRQLRLTARVEKSWKNHQKSLLVKLYAQALYLRNHSDDLLYDYTATNLGAGIGVEF